MTDDQLLRAPQAAERLNKPLGTLRQWRHRGFGPPSFKVGGTVMYRKSALDQWIKEQEQAG
jgi:predicted DNA-binding transcriptional regulator AlpA